MIVIVEPYDSKAYTYLVDHLQIGAQTAMHTKDPPIDYGAQSKVIEDLATPAPDIGAGVFALTFVVKAIDLGDLS